jgi:hypothetical protein
MSKYQLRAVNQYDLDGNFIKEYPSIKDAVTDTRTNYGSISSCCRGNIKTANGFIWKYNNSYLKQKKDPLDKLIFIDYDDDEF